MFSLRTAWSRAPNRLAQHLEHLQALGQPLIDLADSNPLHARLEYPVERIRAALAAPQVVSYDPEPRGLVSARQAVCRHLAEEYPRAIFFMGKLIFQEERWYHRLFHNETASAIQRRLQFSGIQAMVLPIRVLES